MARRVRWAIFGTGAVAGKFALGLRHAPGAELAAVVSRTAERAQAFAAKLGAAQAIAGYEAAAASDAFDVAYIATPPSLHREHALACIAAGKAVLIEKPFAGSEADARAIVDAARAQNVFCMEAMWTRFMPAVAAAKAAIERGAIGTPRALSASFAVAQRVDPSSSLFDEAQGGGALRHRGVYPLSLALHLLGPAEVAGAWRRLGETGVDEDVSALLNHGGGAVSQIRASLRTAADNGLVIDGDAGELRFLGPIYRPHGIRITRVSPRGRENPSWGAKDRLKESGLAQGARRLADPLLGLARRGATIERAPYAGNGYGHEALAVMACLGAERLEHPLMSLDDTLAVARLVDRIAATAA